MASLVVDSAKSWVALNDPNIHGDELSWDGRSVCLAARARLCPYAAYLDSDGNICRLGGDRVKVERGQVVYLERELNQACGAPRM